jgi:hypothetical protein
VRRSLILATLTLLTWALLPEQAFAHQPFFEERDWRLNAPYQLADPTVSTALYGTLARRGDVDWIVFTGKPGQEIHLSVVIPQIDGQEEFAPTIALVGPGLPPNRLPGWIRRPDTGGAVILEPAPGPAPTFHEPYGGRNYWRRQEARIPLPAGGNYFVAVYHPKGQTGRYTLSIGEKEVRGGDPEYRQKTDRFWTPVPRGGLKEG